MTKRTQVYETAMGFEVTFKPLPPYLKGTIETAYEREVPRPKVPTYEIDTFGGEKEIHYHDETTIEDDEEATAVWEKYQEDLEAWENEVATRLMQAIQLQCIEFDMPQDDNWVALHEYTGVAVPENPIERRLFFLRNNIVGCQEDIQMMMVIPMRLAMEKSEELAAVERLFRLAAQRDTAVSATEEESSVGATGGRTDGSHSMESTARGESLGDETE